MTISNSTQASVLMASVPCGDHHHHVHVAGNLSVISHIGQGVLEKIFAAHGKPLKNKWFSDHPETDFGIIRDATNAASG